MATQPYLRSETTESQVLSLGTSLHSKKIFAKICTMFFMIAPFIIYVARAVATEKIHCEQMPESFADKKVDSKVAVSTKNGKITISFLLIQNYQDDIDKQLYVLLEQPGKNIRTLCDTGMHSSGIISTHLNEKKRGIKLVLNENMLLNQRTISYYFDRMGRLADQITVSGERPELGMSEN